RHTRRAHGAPDADRVGAAARACRRARTHAHAPAVVRRGVAARVRQRRAVSARARHEPAPQGGAEPGAARLHRDRAGRRIPAGAAALMPSRVLRLRGTRAWLLSFGLMAALSMLLVANRELLNQRQAPVALALLLVVLL